MTNRFDAVPPKEVMPDEPLDRMPVRELSSEVADVNGAPSEPPPSEALARRFHEEYERLAPQFGYETREASAVPWEDVPESNRRLMVAVAERILQNLPPPSDAAPVTINEWGRMKAVEYWQNSDMHPLTCGNNSNHQRLSPALANGFAVLVCLNCDYTQDAIPDVVFSHYFYAHPEDAPRPDKHELCECGADITEGYIRLDCAVCMKRMWVGERPAHPEDAPGGLYIVVYAKEAPHIHVVIRQVAVPFDDGSEWRFCGTEQECNAVCDVLNRLKGVEDAPESPVPPEGPSVEQIAKILCRGYHHTMRGYRGPMRKAKDLPCDRCLVWAVDVRDALNREVRDRGEKK